jgi:hypothetical protein
MTAHSLSGDAAFLVYIGGAGSNDCGTSLSRSYDACTVRVFSLLFFSTKRQKRSEGVRQMSGGRRTAASSCIACSRARTARHLLLAAAFAAAASRLPRAACRRAAPAQAGFFVLTTHLACSVGATHSSALDSRHCTASSPTDMHHLAHAVPEGPQEKTPGSGRNR